MTIDETSAALLERAAESERLRELVRVAGSGRGSVVWIEGEAGIGKTSLLSVTHELAREASLIVLAARAGLLEHDLPWNVVRQLFAAVVRADPREQAGLLTGAASLARPALGLSAGEPGDEAGALHGLYWLTTALSDDGPVLITVDDAHWGDLPSLRYLAYLGERIADLPALLVVTVRSSEPQDAHLQAIGLQAAVSDRIRLEALSRDASAALTRRVLGPGAGEVFCAACHASTGGNPFLLWELLGELERQGIAPGDDHANAIARITPESVRRAVLLRLSLLSSGTRALAIAISIGGGELELAEAAALAGLSIAEGGAAADALVSVGILAPGAPLRFAHPLIREVVYADLPEHERARRHGDAARQLSARGADTRRVAVQLLRSAPEADGWVVEQLREAARAALSEGAARTAADFLRRALEEPPPSSVRIDVLRELAGAEALIGSGAAIVHLDEAFRAAPDQAVKLQVGLELAVLLSRYGQLSRAVALSRELLSGAHDGHRAVELSLVAAGVTSAVLSPSLHSEIDPLLTHIPEALPGQTREERAALSAQLAVSLVRAAPMGDVADLAERTLAGGALLEELTAHELLYWNAASALIVADRFAPARAAIESAFEDARRRGSIVGFALASCFQCLLDYRTGRIAQGTAAGRQAVGAATAGELHVHAYAVAFLLDCLIERGELSEALSLAESPTFASELPDLFVFHLLRVARARTRIASGDADAGVRELLEVGESMALGRFSPSVCPWRSRTAVGLVALGRHDDARRLAEEELRLARASEATWAEVVALGALALASPETGRDGLERAIELSRRHGFALEHARALVLLGALHRRNGQRKLATEFLREGLDRSVRCGALSLEERAHAELTAAGLRPRRRSLTGVDSLTTGERRVAELAADGLSNREIAQALFVSMRTVETHLTHTYQKLGIQSRSELSGALRDPIGSRP